MLAEPSAPAPTVDDPSDRRWHLATVAALVVLVLLSAGDSAAVHGTNLLRWDWMRLSGFVVFLAGALAAYGLPACLEETIDDLVGAEVIVGPPGAVTALLAGLRRERRHWQHVAGLAAALAIASGFVAVGLIEGAPRSWLLGLVATLLAYPAGRYLGTMAQAGRLHRHLARHGLHVVARPGAPDLTGGLRPLGDYYFRQATVVSLPAAYLAAWLVLVMVVEYFGRRYGSWLPVHTGLLVVALGFVVLAFVLPLRAFHRDMVRQKRRYLAQVRGVTGQISRLRDRVLESQDTDEIRRLSGDIELWSRRVAEIRAMPTWPIAPPTRRRFTLNNTVLACPLVVQLFADIGLGGAWFAWLRAHLGP